MAGAINILLLWVVPRLGFLPYIVWNLTVALLLGSITSHLSAWHAPHGLISLGLVAALAGFGFFTSQAGRPLFRES